MNISLDFFFKGHGNIMKTFSNKKNNKKQNMIKNNLMASVFGMSFIEGG
jgi:hypothetical protein